MTQGPSNRRRHQARELALKALFSYEVGGGDALRELARRSEEEEADEAVFRFAAELVEGVLADWQDLNAEIRRLARSWSLERIAFVDRNILRLALYELRRRPDIPVSVSINEAVELSKVYGGADSGRFVNGILGQSARDREAREADGPGTGDAVATGAEKEDSC